MTDQDTTASTWSKLAPTLAVLGIGGAGGAGIIEGLDLFGQSATEEHITAMEDHILFLEENLENCISKRDELGQTIIDALIPEIEP